MDESADNGIILTEQEKWDLLNAVASEIARLDRLIDTLNNFVAYGVDVKTEQINANLAHAERLKRLSEKLIP